MWSDGFLGKVYTVSPCIVRPKYPKEGVHYAKPHYVKPHYTSAWIV